jgi:hypothetical protein
VKLDDQNLKKFDLEHRFTNDVHPAVTSADLIVFCTAHRDYLAVADILGYAPRLLAVFDACNLLPENEVSAEYRLR